MAQCVAIQPDQTLKVVNGVCDFVIVTHAEFEQIQQHGLATVLNELFAFDLPTFGLINTAALVAFISAHCIGRIARLMGKT
tara:strand:- start:3128 stop:3370 length:243 start_codon:yes stop_codon:yes gene_type:complete